MNVKGKEVVEVSKGFADPSQGWHTCSIQEGIDLMKTGDGEVVYSKFGKKLPTLLFPLQVDEAGEEDGRKGQIFVNFEDRSEEGMEALANVITCAGMWEKFEERFPGNIDIWSEPVVNAVKTKLVGKFIDVYFYPNKKGRMSVVKFQKVGLKREDPSILKSAGGAKTGEGAGAKKEPAKAATPEWED